MLRVVNPYTDEQLIAWLRGLLTVAWIDGNFDDHEQELIATTLFAELAPNLNQVSTEPITPEELAQVLGKNRGVAENFLRMAVMVAIADGIYSILEDRLLHQFCHALGQKKQVLEALRHTLCDCQESERSMSIPDAISAQTHGDVLHHVRDWLDGWEIHDPRVARFFCKMIPAQCPFERDIKLFGHKLVHIQPLCKLNPLYDQLVGLRFRALSYLADECKEDVSAYC
ncbi:MAG: nitrogenase [Chroococcidiopsidaceae cyanobacterium CP_BM_ER_R8_30]|nr:nitrogenase [Chroococcidiopsidaceae cyanobacterium CP_BM_ER_R8_30]